MQYILYHNIHPCVHFSILRTKSLSWNLSYNLKHSVNSTHFSFCCSERTLSNKTSPFLCILIPNLFYLFTDKSLLHWNILIFNKNLPSHFTNAFVIFYFSIPNNSGTISPTHQLHLSKRKNVLLIPKPLRLLSCAMHQKSTNITLAKTSFIFSRKNTQQYFSSA